MLLKVCVLKYFCFKIYVISRSIKFLHLRRLICICHTHIYIHTHILSNTSAHVPLTDSMKQSLFREADGYSEFQLPLSKHSLSPLLHCDLLKNFHMLLRKNDGKPTLIPRGNCPEGLLSSL